MEFQILEELEGEICHHYGSFDGNYIASKANTFFGKINGSDFSFKIPINYKDHIRSINRLSRRLTRRDKSNAYLNFGCTGIVVIYLGKVYFFELQTKKIVQTAELKQCRNALHQSMYVGENRLMFGEYGLNKTREPVPIWESKDDGRSWCIVQYLDGIRHVHGVHNDPYSNDIWICTGDLDGECKIVQLKDGDVNNSRIHGDGTQVSRPVGIYFAPNYLAWGMDSEVTQCHIVKLDRNDGRLSLHAKIPGPNWYSKLFTDGTCLYQTTVEIGVGSTTNFAHLFYSENGIDLQKVGEFKKDVWPKTYFKFGIIGFANGAQSKDDFVIFGEALSGIDGKILRCRLV